MILKKKKILGIILSLVLVLGMAPGMGLTVYAADYETIEITNDVYDATSVSTLIGSLDGFCKLSSEEAKSWEPPTKSGNERLIRDYDGEYIWVAMFENGNYLSDSSLPLDMAKYGEYGEIKYYYAKKTVVAVNSVTLNKTSATLAVGGTEMLTATVNPGDATDKSVTWSSDKTSVATVDANGKVTAVAKGTANITVTATNGTEDTSDDKTATCAVIVNEASSGGDSSDSGNSGSSDSGNTGGGTSSGSSDNTNTTTGTSAKVPYDKVVISTGAVNDITGTVAATAESNPFETKIENNDNLTTLLSLTDAEVAQGVNVWLDIQDMSATVPQTDKDIVQNASTNLTVGMYLDINLFKKVGGNEATKITETNGTVKASILIPESLWKSGRTFEIIRVHDGVPTVISGTYDENTHAFTFETDKFSTYALVYKDLASSSDSSNNTQFSTPKTGDPNDIRVWYLLLLASLGGLGFLGLSKKKKVND